MEPEEDIEVITNFMMRNKLLDTMEEVKQLERLLKEAKVRLKMEMERRGIWGWKRWLWSWLGYY
jgi:predicted nucleotidyltransferase